ncbi:hypothetical protein LZ906_017550 (plasmid) [Paraclostridium ghonii]|uniref:hypothetical protein n=1 Tax=Paraclostridium ghonii TaxID=29358 RepID=UPI00202CC5A9|nr:hypothetical protein [Paeniclostridium ghonii]MCM0166536.1 hypothetical protein [Paeniclostridium ghonii]
MWLLIAIILAMVTCVSVNYTKNIIYEKSIDNLKWKYNVGDKLIYRQSNCYIDRLIGCEVLGQFYSKKFEHRNTPYYKVKVYTEELTIWNLKENDFECTAEKFGEFPKYNKANKK